MESKATHEGTDMTKPMVKYNRALDCLALAAQAMHRDGDEVLAARLFAKACKQSDMQAALDTIEATNRYAFAQLQASKAEQTPAPKKPTQAAAKPAQTPTPTKAAAKPSTAVKRVQAAEEMAEEESEFPVEDVEEEHVEADFGADPLDDVVEEEEVEEAPVEPVVAGRRMAEVLSSMKQKRDGK
jgi:hypothetical protein